MLCELRLLRCQSKGKGANIPSGGGAVFRPDRPPWTSLRGVGLIRAVTAKERAIDFRRGQGLPD